LVINLPRTNLTEPDLRSESVTIVIPTLNEAESIGSVIDELKECGFSNILVVDGHSTDRTVEIAREKGVSVVLQHGSGKRDALETAFEIVKTPYLVVMDGDMSYDAHDIKLLMDHREGYDQVVGARRMTSGNMTWLHRIGNRIITRAFNIFFATKLRDVCSGMYLIRTEKARTLQFSAGKLTVEEEILAQNSVEGNVTDVPINYRPRLGGKSQVSTWRQGFADVVTLFDLARKYNAVMLFSTISALAIIPATLILLWVLYEAIFHQSLHQGYALLGVMLLLVAGQGFTVTTLYLQLRRLERRLSKRT